MDITTLENVSYLNKSTTLVTPEIAKEFWSGNENNPRPFKTHVANDYARQMRLSRWGKSPEPIVITKSGKMGNGQHRVWAVINTGIAQNFHVMVIEDEQFDEVCSVLDQGAPRTSSDILQIDSAIIRPINYLLRCSGISKVKPDDLLPYVESDMGRLLTKMIAIKCKGKTWRHTCFRAAMTVAILDGSIGDDNAFEIYNTLNEEVLTDWPKIFAELYIQLNDSGKSLNHSGRSFENDWFTRGLYAFQKVNEGTKTIRITKSFQHDAKAKSLSALYSINPIFLS